MRRSETVNIRELIQSLIREHGLESRLAENRLVNSWQNLVGIAVARRTKNIYISKRILYVHLDSSVVRSELMMIGDELLKRLNQEAGSKVIDRIVFR